VNYVLQYKGPGRPTREEVDDVRSIEGLRVLDESAFSLLVEMTPETFSKCETVLPDWEVSPEVVYLPPTTRKSVDEDE
jgi:hypothetical protein